MAELRWHPLIKDWVMIASHRQDRPQMPKVREGYLMIMRFTSMTMTSLR